MAGAPVSTGYKYDFTLLVVLFILLVIVGSAYFC
ncbi:YjcZ family sporulation protein [Halalkalibacter sp. AB-rgal2]|nr:YjcZ family sporulation protein [Halalkalibacter hemicellulosilyticus]MCK0473956.1 YjcZ family sporulation protein [Halalkalibacter sp. APA_J-10(15)]